MLQRLPRRKRRLLVTAGLAVAFVMVTAVVIPFAAGPEAPYRPGESIEGLTTELARSLPPDYPRVTFTDATTESGIQFTHFYGRRTTQLPEDYGSGVAWGDYDGDGWQDVFMKEVNTVRALFDNRFDTRGHSVVLINNAKTLNTTPIASTTALQAALKRVGTLLNPEEDVLFLFVTSHGSDDPAYLSIDQDGLDLTQLTPGRLKAALAATPIKWKVIVVSACYSGGFIPALRDDNTLVITASSADRNSFGCDARNSMTDFGRAYFAEALNQTTSFTAAFELARKRIAAREKTEKLTPSLPQMEMGKNFAAKWRGRFD